MDRIIHSQVRDERTAINAKTKLLIVVVAIVLISYKVFNNAFHFGFAGQQCFVLIGYVSYLAASIWYLTQLIPVACQASDRIIVKENGVYVERLGKLICDLKWEDVSEVGLLRGSGPHGYHVTPVYFSPTNFDTPVFMKDSGDERKVKVPHGCVWYTSRDLTYLSQVLVGFDEWLEYACDLEKTANMQYGKMQVTNIYMQKKVIGAAKVVTMPFQQYHQLTKESRYHAMVISMLRMLYAGYTLVLLFVLL